MITLIIKITCCWMLLISYILFLQDLEVLECMGWEAVIIDECQRPRISTHYAEYRMLVTDLRLLLFSGQMKACFLICFKLKFVSCICL